MEGWRSKKIDGSMDGGMDGRMDAWTCTHVCVCVCLQCAGMHVYLPARIKMQSYWSEVIQLTKRNALLGVDV